MKPDDSFWKRKLLAFLHDPPDKPYDYSKDHISRAKRFAARFGLSDNDLKTGGLDTDWAAAAADRFIFPDGRKAGRSLGGGVAFHHPLAGIPSPLPFPKEWSAESEIAFQAVDDSVPDFAGIEDPRLKFFLAWRLWREFTATHKGTPADGQAGALAYLPADTRVPDGTIWHHMSVVSALEATRGTDGKLHPAMLLFKLGPVQDFIAQARSTRDLWSGSYLLSWLMAHALQSLANAIGPDCIIYPSLRGQPLFDWLSRDTLRQGKHATHAGESQNYWEASKLAQAADLALIPNLPNTFLAVVPVDLDVDQIVVQPLRKEWAGIAEACWTWLDQRNPLGPGDSNKARLWRHQVDNFLQTSWQLWPWRDLDETLSALGTLPEGGKSPLPKSRKIAESIPADRRDGRCCPINVGWAWSAHYALASHHHDARRQTREFASWATAEISRGAEKDALSGREEAIADKDWLEGNPEKGIKSACHHKELKHLFKPSDRLGAPNLIKRVWHRAYLPDKELKRATQAFDSVPSVAAAAWRAKLLQKAKSEGGEPLCHALDAFGKACDEMADAFDWDYRRWEDTRRAEKWLEWNDASLLLKESWPEWEDSEAPEAARKALDALDEIHKRAGKPPKYFAVLALDGDKMGEWVSGQKNPHIGDVLAKGATEYFSAIDGGKDWLKDTPRPVSPSFHLQLSEALANFGVYCARRIVEAHHGQLIYSGGDDVLAMLPAEEALPCADDLRLAFRGDPALAQRHPDSFAAAPDGFVQLASPKRFEPPFPLLVPGPEADVSAGIAIAHMHSPLQNVIEAARRAESRAKNEYGRAAFAVSLFKRSGEIIEWGAKWATGAIALTRVFRELRENDRLTARFPYALAELLLPYAHGPDWRIAKHNGFDPFEVFPLELSHVLGRQSQREWRNSAGRRAFQESVEHYLKEDCDGRTLNDFLGPFHTETFLSRGGSR